MSNVSSKGTTRLRPRNTLGSFDEQKTESAVPKNEPRNERLISKRGSVARAARLTAPITTAIGNELPRVLSEAGTLLQAGTLPSHRQLS